MSQTSAALTETTWMQMAPTPFREMLHQKNLIPKIIILKLACSVISKILNILYDRLGHSESAKLKKG